MRILVAGVGNVLRADDGFGIRVIEALIAGGRVPAGVDLYEAGIGGIPLVQELMKGYDVLVIADAIDRQVEPGTLLLLEPDLSETPRTTIDAHTADPSQVVVLARALGVCPSKVLIVGCQYAQVEDAVEQMHPAVARAVPLAVERILALIETLKSSNHIPQP